jgi:aspartate/methionine/tyrosine aminotransferase
VASVLFQRASNEPETMNGTATRPTAPSSLAVDHIYPPINDLPFSRIREISRIGMEREGVIPLWFGEPDRPTPDFIIDAATEAMRAGKTFYTQNRGIPELRAALADYLGGLYGRPVDFERVTVTASAMNGLMIVMQTLLGPDDNVVAQGPLWPNTAETVHIQGAETREVTLDLRPEGWVLDLERLFDRCDGRTRAILVNSPSNPVGWMMGTDQQAELLAFCRQRGLWIISDEVYDRIVYDTRRAPSFVDLAEPEDLVLSVNSFSKSWCMTGWRLGWIVAPESLGLTLEKMNEYNITLSAGPRPGLSAPQRHATGHLAAARSGVLCLFQGRRPR